MKNVQQAHRSWLGGVILIAFGSGCQADVAALQKSIAEARGEEAAIYAPASLGQAQDALRHVKQTSDPERREQLIQRGLEAATIARTRASRLRYQAKQRGIQHRKQRAERRAVVEHRREVAIKAAKGGLGLLPTLGRATVPQIQADRLHQRLTRGHNTMVIDVRGRRAFEKGHISGALLAPAQSLKHRRLPAQIDLVVYADKRTRGQDRVAAQLLVAGGHDRVFLLEGGFEQWLALGLPWTQLSRRGGAAGMITARELSVLLSDAERAPLLIDLRAKTAYAAGHLSGAIHAPEVLGIVAQAAGGRDLVVYSASDSASARQAQRMTEQTGRKVSFVKGGLRALIAQGHRLVRGDHAAVASLGGGR